MLKRILLFVLSVTVVLGLAAFGVCAQEAGGVDISPHIIDEQGEAGGIFEHSLTVSNNTERKVNLYPVVNNLTAKQGRQEFTNNGETDRSRSLANWIEVTRGVQELDPGESKTLPLKIDISPYAKPGEYYASVTLAAGSDRYAAEKKMKSSNQPRVLVNLVIEEHIVENAQIKSFETGKKVNFSYPVSFALKIKNSGNQKAKPVGEIFVYNRRGKEVAALPLSAGQNGIKPSNSQILETAWEKGAGMGRFKAKVQMDYGRESTRDLQDTLYFWVLPWPWVAAFSFGILILLFGLFYLLFRKAHHIHHQPSQTPPSQEKEGVINLREK